MYLKNKILPYLLIVRPGICVGVVVLVTLSTLAAEPHSFNLIKALMAGLGVGLSAGAGSVINDLFDWKADFINNPQRMLPQKLLSIKAAALWYILLLTLAFVSFGIVSITVIATGFLCNAVLFLYSWKIREVNGLIANIAIASLIAGMFSFGALVAGTISDKIIILFVFGFLVSLPREILGAVRDIEGDKMQGKIRTLPITIGVRNSVILAIILLYILVLFGFAPLVMGIFPGRWAYYGFVLSFLFVISINSAMQKLQRDEIKPVHNMLKAVMFCYPFTIILPTLLFS